MENKNKHIRVGFSTILWAVLAIVLCAAQGVLAQDVTVPSSTHPSPCDIDYTISGNLNVNSGGTVNLLPGANITYMLYAWDSSSVVNIKGGQVGWWIAVMNQYANITVCGKYFEKNVLPLDPIPNQVTFDAGTNMLFVTYSDDTFTTLKFDSSYSITINLVNTAGDTTPPDIICPGDITVVAMGPDGVPVDDERIQNFLAGASATDDCDPSEEIIITNDAPALFSPGDTIVNFTATDTSGNMSTCSSTVTVVEATEEGRLRIIPPIINREGRLTKILAVIRFPEGTNEDDIDMDEPLVLFAGYSPYDIVSTNQRIISWCRWGTLRVSIFAFFDKDEVMAAVPEDGPVEFMVVGRFVNGDYFYGTDTVRIVSWDWTWW